MDTGKMRGLWAISCCLFLSSFEAKATQVEVWITDESLERRLQRLDDVTFLENAETASLQVTIDEGIVYQVIDGWGVSLTGASSWLLSEKLTESKREEVMENLFGPSGIGLSMLRQTIGASDFNSWIYSYSDGGVDPELERFSIDPDREYILPRVREALSINPQIKVMGSPWSPPGWMKTSGSMVGGTLKDEFYQNNADYLVKFVEAYESEGVPIYAITPQNEPGYSPAHYPGMTLTKSQQIRFIGDYLGPSLLAAGLGRVKIICHDHNYEGVDNPRGVLLSSAGEYVAGSGFHHYGGPIQAMSALKSEFPDKGIWFTEGGFGEWNDHFDNIVHEMIEIPRNWARSIILWNAALDQNSGPSVIGEDNPNEGMLLIRSDGMDDVKYNGQYYFLGHLSKFARPGSVRLGSPSWEGDVETIAFRNLDGSRVLVLANRSVAARTIKVIWEGQTFVYEVPRRCMMTFRWRGVGDDSPPLSNLKFGKDESAYAVRFDIDTSRFGPLFNVEESKSLVEADWDYVIPQKEGNEAGVETWVVESGDLEEQAFFKVNVWP